METPNELAKQQRTENSGHKEQQAAASAMVDDAPSNAARKTFYVVERAATTGENWLGLWEAASGRHPTYQPARIVLEGLKLDHEARNDRPKRYRLIECSIVEEVTTVQDL